MKKTISILTLIFILLFSFSMAESGDSYQMGYDAGYNAGYIEGKEKVYKPSEPNVILVSQDSIPTINAGSDFTLILDYKNDSEYTARSIRITPVFEQTPLVYERPVTYEAESNLKSQKIGTAAFGLKIKDNAKNGVYPINFKISYKNTSEENFSKTAIAYIKVTGEKIKSLVTVSNISTDPATITAGQRFNLNFNVNNVGEIPMNDATIKLTGFNVEGIMPADGADSSYIGTLNPNTSVTRSFNLIASEKISKGSNSLGVTIKYKNENKDEITEEKTIYIFNVLNPNKKSGDDESNVGKPKLIIESYSTMPNGTIVAGDSFVLSFAVKNTSKDLAIKNMKVTISSDNSGAFMIANGSNTFYVEKIPPQGYITNSIRLNVKQDLTSKSYPVNITFDYEDDNNGSSQSTEVLSIPVVEYSNLVINNVTPSDGLVNEQVSLSFDYINMGKATISNLTASVEGDYTSAQSINYIGNLEAGNSDYYDIQVIPTKEGENVGTLVLTFEDSSGKKIDVRREFTGNAMSEAFFEEPGMNEPDIPTEEGEYLSVWQYIGIGIGSFVASFLLAKFITTKIIRKKLEDEI